MTLDVAKSRNSGFTLVELIVSILIMSVVMGIVTIAITTSRVTYREVNTDAVLQGEGEVIRQFIGEIAVEARVWGSSSLTRTVSGIDYTYDYVWFKAPDNESTDRKAYSTYVFMHRKDKSVLSYGKYPGDLAMPLADGTSFPAADNYGCNILDDIYAVLAEHVTGISLEASSDDVSLSDSRRLISMDMTLEYNNHDYKMTMNYQGRNNVSE